MLENPMKFFDKKKRKQELECS